MLLYFLEHLWSCFVPKFAKLSFFAYCSASFFIFLAPYGTVNCHLQCKLWIAKCRPSHSLFSLATTIDTVFVDVWSVHSQNSHCHCWCSRWYRTLAKKLNKCISSLLSLSTLLMRGEPAAVHCFCCIPCTLQWLWPLPIKIALSTWNDVFMQVT